MCELGMGEGLTTPRYKRSQHVNKALHRALDFERLMGGIFELLQTY